MVENPWQEQPTYFEDLYADESHRSATVFDFSGIAGYLPITSEVYAVLYAGKPVAQAVRDLLSRPLKKESY